MHTDILHKNVADVSLQGINVVFKNHISLKVRNILPVISVSHVASTF